MTMNNIIIDGYLRAWGWFKRIDREGNLGVSSVKWRDFVGSNSVQCEDKVLDRTCEAMNQIKSERFDIWALLRDMYVDDKALQDIAIEKNTSRQSLRNLKSEGFKMLRLMLLGCSIEEGRHNHWGEFPSDDKLAAPKTMKIA